MDHTAIFHVSSGNTCYVVDHDRLAVRIRIKRGDVHKIILYYKNVYDHSPDIHQITMDLLMTDGDFAYYENVIQVKEKHFKYFFEIHPTSGPVCYYTSDGVNAKPKPENYFYYPAINKDDIRELPAWAEGEIIYQILVDRFYDGEPDNNPQAVKPRDALPDRETYYGGDFQGVVQKLDYLESYGVKIIYLSPSFKSPSYHKYDISDYYEIEAIYGGKTALRQLVEAAHKKGIKVILDAVFNHCSSEHPFFQDVLNRQEKSAYGSWFRIDDFPVSYEKGNYDNFANEVPSMPKWETTNPEVIHYLSTQAAYWIRELDIDGYRFDVADEISHRFWQELHNRVRRVKKTAILIGEIWNHATPWVKASELDTVTNYKYRQYLLALMESHITPKEFIHYFHRNKSFYETPVYHYLIHLAGSHDTVRLMTELNNEKRHYLALGITLLMEGMPLIYYGDEIGMEGDVDPDNRRAMQWDKPLNEEARLIQQIAKLRAESDILKKGKTTFLENDPDVLCFTRTHQEKTWLVVANLGNKPIRVSQARFRLLLGLACTPEKDQYLVLPDQIALFSQQDINQ